MMEPTRADASPAAFPATAERPMALLPLEVILPPEMAHRAEETGVHKVQRDALSLFLLAVLAGAFVALGALFFTRSVRIRLPRTRRWGASALGNLVGGSVLVGGVYWVIYRRHARR